MQLRLCFAILPLVAMLLTTAPALVSVASAAPKDSGARPVTGEQAKQAAEKWLTGLGDKGLVIRHSIDKEHGFIVKHAPSAVGRITKFSYQQPGWWITFTFKGEHTADTPIATLRKQFWFCTVDRIVTPGLKIPGWEVRPRTPSSSFSKGVELVSMQQGKAKFRVKTSFFALYGRNPNVLVPADAPSPAGTYFQVRKSFPLDLTIEGSYTFK